ncbi:MAG: hypothetical protein H6Q00_2590 [Holophagaceae bacterium]|nr:hypothetical protein [Holophagaceae bacterium]
MLPIRRTLPLVALLACSAPAFCQATEAAKTTPSITPEALPRFSVQDGYLVAHLPEENVTVIAQAPSGPAGEDRGWASWTQRGELLWRGQMEDSQGRTYNVRVLPGYVAPWHYGGQGWSDAASNLGEYGEARTWTRLGRESRDCFKWGWEDSLWEFGIKGSGKAWSQNFKAAGRRVQRKTFGWPLAYPWAAVSSSFETLLRVPLGAAGALVGTAGGAVVVPAFRVAAPGVKAVYHAGVDGTLLPVAGWSWQTLAAPPAALLASAPTPSRADGTWMKVQEPKAAPRPTEPVRSLSAPALETLGRYAAETVKLKVLEAEAQRREQEELAALRARHREARKALQEARSQQLLAWAAEPANQAALEALLQEGGDAASIRANREALEKTLLGMGFSSPEAQEAVSSLGRHPIRQSAPAPRALPDPKLSDKTDPVRGALDTVDRVTGTRIVR